MRFFRLSLILDTIFVFLGISIILLVIFNFYVNYPFSLVLTFSLSLLLTIFCVKLLTVRQSKIKIKESDKIAYIDCMIRLNLMKKQNLVNLLAKCEQNSEVQIYSNYFFNKNTNTFHFVKYGFYKVTKTDIVIAFNYLENTQIAYIYSEKFEQEIIDFAKRFNNKIILVDGKETFLILKNKNLLPTFDFEEVFNKKQKPAFLKEILKKKNAKRFFLFGVMFIAFSFFVPIKIYYLLCGSIMIAFALFNKLFGKDKKHD